MHGKFVLAINDKLSEIKAQLVVKVLGFEITLNTDKLAKNLYMPLGDEEGFFSDNYFDLIPG